MRVRIITCSNDCGSREFVTMLDDEGEFETSADDYVEVDCTLDTDEIVEINAASNTALLAWFPFGHTLKRI